MSWLRSFRSLRTAFVRGKFVQPLSIIVVNLTLCDFQQIMRLKDSNLSKLLASQAVLSRLFLSVSQSISRGHSTCFNHVIVLVSNASAPAETLVSWCAARVDVWRCV